jgi:DNA-binding transcriptional LysR family regulator
MAAAMFDWDDLRCFLAVGRRGTTLAAAAELGISQPTVTRRIAALEQAGGVALFDRSPAGYTLTDAGRALLPIAERAAAEMQAAADLLAGRRNENAGRIRLMLPDSMEEMLLEMLQDFRRDWPGIEVQILTSYTPLDLARGEADIAVRVTNRPESDALLVRTLPNAAWTVYGSRRLAEQRPLPDSTDRLEAWPLIGADGPMVDWKAYRWLERVAPEATYVLRCNSIGGIRTAVRSGIGLSPLPCLLANTDPELVPCFPPPPEIDTLMWLATRRELRHVPHFRAFYEGLYSHINAHVDRLARPGSDRFRAAPVDPGRTPILVVGRDMQEGPAQRPAPGLSGDHGPSPTPISSPLPPPRRLR